MSLNRQSSAPASSRAAFAPCAANERIGWAASPTKIMRPYTKLESGLRLYRCHRLISVALLVSFEIRQCLCGLLAGDCWEMEQVRIESVLATGMAYLRTWRR